MRFEHLPVYAKYLLDNHIEALAAKQLELIRSVNPPILRFFNSLPESELLLVSRQSIAELLACLAGNNAESYISNLAEKLAGNSFSGISQNQLQPDDITLLSFTFNAALSHFITAFTSDAGTVINITGELNSFITRLSTKCLTLLFDIRQGSFRQMQSLAKIGNWIWDLETGKYTWSEELFNIYELEPQDEITYSLASFNHPDDREMIEETLRTSKETLQPYSFQYRIISKNGKQKILRAHGEVKADKNGKARTMFGTLQDVTDLQQKVDEIKKSEERYHQMIDEVKDYAILLLNVDGIIQNWNKGAEKIKGYSEEEVIGKNFRIFYTAEDRKNNLAETLINRAAKTGKAAQEGWRVKKDGSLFWASVVITALHDKDGNVIGFTKVTRDLTEKKLVEDKMLQYAQQLEQKNIELERSYKEMESFSYVASHDLQEPLRKIKTFSDRIIEKEPLTENARSYFNRIIQSCGHMQRLINALLDYSRTNNTTAVFEDVDLNVTISDIQSNLLETIEEKNGIIETSDLPVIKGIPLQIYQLFFNIISNSIKYSKADTAPRIRVSCETVVADKLLPSLTYQSWHKVTVTDNGIGFEQQYAEKIFELFQRLHGKSEYSGTGIGLAICKKIVQNHNGYIRAISEPGKGASFHIFFPI